MFKFDLYDICRMIEIETNMPLYAALREQSFPLSDRSCKSAITSRRLEGFATPIDNRARCQQHQTTECMYSCEHEIDLHNLDELEEGQAMLPPSDWSSNCWLDCN